MGWPVRCLKTIHARERSEPLDDILLFLRQHLLHLCLLVVVRPLIAAPPFPCRFRICLVRDDRSSVPILYFCSGRLGCSWGLGHRRRRAFQGATHLVDRRWAWFGGLSRGRRCHVWPPGRASRRAGTSRPMRASSRCGPVSQLQVYSHKHSVLHHAGSKNQARRQASG